MPNPTLVMVAGPNGSGKSTLIKSLRADAVFGRNLPAMYVNADDIQRDQGFDAATAQRAATELRRRAFAERRDIMYETVMSHPSKLAELQAAKDLGYDVHVFFVATGDPAINVDRVRLRVKAGGHDVPQDRTLDRYTRTLRYAPVAISLADQAHVFDNSSARRGIDLQAYRQDGLLQLSSHDAAPWVVQLASEVNLRAKELAQLQARAGELGVQLQGARLDSGKSDGVVEMVSDQYVVQHDRRGGAFIAHDTKLLPRLVRQGEDLMISYEDGTCEVASREQHQTR